MRVIHVTVPKDRTEIVQTILTKLGTKFTTISDENNTLFLITELDENVETLIGELRKLGVGSLYGSFQVYAPEYASGAAEIKTKRIPSKRASREEILADIRELARLDRNYILFSILAAMLATLGLLTDNIVIIIASMIIAPFIGPILGTSLGIVLNLDDLRQEGALSESVGLGLSVLTGFLFSLILPHTYPTSQIMLRAQPSYVDVLFAVVAGFAVAISVVSVTSMALVGVAIAASLVPPAANIGIGVTFLIKGVPEGYQIIFGSTLLLVINVLAITTTSLLFFWFEGLTPGESIRKKIMAKKVVRNRLIVTFIILLIVLAPIVVMSYQHYQQIQMENQITNATKEYISINYQNVDVLSIDVKYILTQRKAIINLQLGVTNITNQLLTLPNNLSSYISSSFNIDCIVYVDFILKGSSQSQSVSDIPLMLELPENLFQLS